MKKLIMLLLVATAMVLYQGCDNKMTASVWGDNDIIGARAGYMVTENVEFGGSALFLPDKETPEAWGVYGKYILPELVQIPIPEIALLDFLPEIIKGSPYIGSKLDFVENNDASLIAGFDLEPFFIEWQPDSFDRTSSGTSKFLLGLHGRF